MMILLKMKITLKFLLLLIAVKIFFLAIIFLCVDNNWIDIPINNSKAEVKQRTGFYMFILIGLIGPLLEECMFRLPLVAKPINFSISGTIIFLYLYSFYTGVELDSLEFFGQRFLLSSVLFVLIYGFCSKYSTYLNTHWRNFKIISIVLMSFLFAIFHLLNYDSKSLSFLSGLVVVVPYFISGLIYSHVRLNYNFRLVILIHMLFNSMGFVLTYPF